MRPKKEEKREKPESCREKDKCRICGKLGHWSRECPDKKKKLNDEKTTLKNQAQPIRSVKRWDGRLNGEPASVLLDSCADISCIAASRVFSVIKTSDETSPCKFYWGKALIQPLRSH